MPTGLADLGNQDWIRGSNRLTNAEPTTAAQQPLYIRMVARGGVSVASSPCSAVPRKETPDPRPLPNSLLCHLQGAVHNGRPGRIANLGSSSGTRQGGH